MLILLTDQLFCLPGSSAKSVGEEAVDMATISAPTASRTEGRHNSTGEVNGFISPSQETLPAPQLNAVHDGTAAPPSTLPGKTAPAALLGRPTSLQPEKDAASPIDVTQAQSQVKGDHQPCLPTNGFSLDSAETSVFSPSSLSDSDLLEATFDDTPSPAPEQPTDLSVNVHVKEIPSTDTMQSMESDIMGEGKGETTNKPSHLPETVGQEKWHEETAYTRAKTSGQDEVDSCKLADPKKSLITLDEGIMQCDVPDALEPEDLASVSEALKPDPKKQMKLFNRNKKKSNQGNLSIHFNKGHLWNASLLTFLKGNPLIVLFLFHLTFSILCMGYFTICA